jgi:8-hydroxy-5-deazaflavin:NADPH oxidoreductase
VKIGVLGTGMVGRAHAGRLAALGHDLLLGTNDTGKTGAGSGPDGNGTFAQWVETARLRLAPLADAAGADLVIVALNGRVVVDVLAGLATPLAGKPLLDITNPLDFSTGHLQLFVCNTDSLGEQIQRALPRSSVVKTLCTVTADVQVDPQAVGGGEHDMFVAGNDPAGKTAATDLLGQYGWRSVIDLGGIAAARGMEMMMPMWLNLLSARGTARFGYRIIT